jgi:hypothetical protein
MASRCCTPESRGSGAALDYLGNGYLRGPAGNLGCAAGCLRRLAELAAHALANDRTWPFPFAVQ